eukprot:gnl/TRDRNA2_/TRDRNA2_170216_c0_seq1.p1 gnl/TRDRNA2_/TRDRNA2_170216_c0~~gnl/TRDRNA2_/TRDRNA2_170216_c0_seq1.p1  ORF type:complete len:390 (-),score=75.26 gnl/TRDRNA2_/TRDRNA2_170216_c0_seq1:39-1208(-)
MRKLMRSYNFIFLYVTAAALDWAHAKDEIHACNDDVALLQIDQSASWRTKGSRRKPSSHEASKPVVTTEKAEHEQDGDGDGGGKTEIINVELPKEGEGGEGGERKEDDKHVGESDGHIRVSLEPENKEESDVAPQEIVVKEEEVEKGSDGTEHEKVVSERHINPETGESAPEEQDGDDGRPRFKIVLHDHDAHTGPTPAPPPAPPPVEVPPASPAGEASPAQLSTRSVSMNSALEFGRFNQTFSAVLSQPNLKNMFGQVKDVIPGLADKFKNMMTSVSEFFKLMVRKQNEKITDIKSNVSEKINRVEDKINGTAHATAAKIEDVKKVMEEAPAQIKAKQWRMFLQSVSWLANGLGILSLVMCFGTVMTGTGSWLTWLAVMLMRTLGHGW